ncbi:1521e1a3-eedc-455a-b5da-4054f20718a4 [Thermothielavioides terrestris]|uniref:1521e1a3-eedc-455a-b5da-4054f20718a4 n=1 Tax=Thermothielavioides terrestris TaxID=2587410 RepID=A0A3S4AVC2_9PEZI|nr:1521e1a3-eedc-455a-b5da-4054f20718a4 [Thermothielavioides terrestris]
MTYLLTALPAGHTLLLLLPRLRARKLGLLLGRLDLVAHSVELLLLVVVVLLQPGPGTLALDPVVTRGRHLAVHDSPDFLGQVLGELGAVGDDDDTTLELLQRLGQCTKRVAVEVVGRLIENDQVRTLPRASGKNNLDTLATRQTAHAGVGYQLGIQTEVGAVRLDLPADQGAELARSEGLLHIHLGHQLLVRGEQLATRQPGVVGRHHGHPALVLHADVLAEDERALVLVAVLELPATVDADDAALSAIDLEDLVHGLLVGLGDDLVGAVHGLAILAGLETPLDVLGRGLVQVVIDVGERVLLDVGDTDVFVLVDLTAGGNELAGEDVDQRGLASTVGANDGNTRAERALEGDVGELRLGSARVLEAHLVGTQDGLGLGLDTLQEAGLRERELHLGGAELVVRLGRRHATDELLEVALVALELEALVVDDVLAHVVKEAAVVRDDDGSARRVDEVVLEPLHVHHVEMVGGLVQKKNIGSLEDGTAQGELHLPTTRERGDLVLDHLVGEAELVQALDDILLGGLDAGLGKLLHGPINGGHFRIGRVQVVLDKDGLDFALLGEALDLLVVDGAHQGGLAGAVGAAQTVALATLEAEVGLVEQNLGTVGEREGAVAQILALLLVILDFVLVSSARDGAPAERIDDALRLGISNHNGDVGLDALGPRGSVRRLLVDQLTGDGSGVLEHGCELLEGSSMLAREHVLQVAHDGGNVTVVAHLGNLAIDDVADADQSVESLLGLLAGLGIGKVFVVLLEARHHLRQERSDDVGIVDELAHVVDDDGRLALDGGVTLGETTVEKRNHEGQSGLLDLGDEGGGAEQVDRLGDVLGLGDTLDELGNEALDIAVDDQLADLLHGLVGAVLDLLLGVPHGLGNHGNEIGDAESSLGRGGADDGVDEVENRHLLGPLLGVPQGVNEGRKNGLDGVGVDRLGDGQRSRDGGVFDGRDLVTSASQDAGEQGDEVGLDMGGNLGVLSDGLDREKGLLADSGILLVGELFLKSLHGPGNGRHMSAPVLQFFFFV